MITMFKKNLHSKLYNFNKNEKHKLHIKEE